MKAALIFHKRQEAYGGIVEMVIWRLPRSDPERPHGLKYRLYFGREGRRLVGYDNERGKGDHRHYESREEPYHFVSLEQLLRDFLDDVTRIGGST